MKTSLTFLIMLFVLSFNLSCTPQEIINNDLNTETVSTGDDDDIGPDNDKDEDED